MDDMEGLGGLEFAEGSKPPVALDWRIAPPAAMRQHVTARGIRKVAADPPATLVPAIDRRPYGACAGMAEKLESPLTAATGILSRPTATQRYCPYLRNVNRYGIGATMSAPWRIRAQQRRPATQCQGRGPVSVGRRVRLPCTACRFVSDLLQLADAVLQRLAQPSVGIGRAFLCGEPTDACDESRRAMKPPCGGDAHSAASWRLPGSRLSPECPADPVPCPWRSRSRWRIRHRHAASPRWPGRSTARARCAWPPPRCRRRR